MNHSPSAERVSPEVFFGRVTEAAIEMDRLNKIDEGRLWITRRGMRRGGAAGFIIRLMLTLGSGLIGSIIVLAMTPDNAANTTHRVNQAMIPLELIPAVSFFLGVYYLRWRGWLLSVVTLFVLLAFLVIAGVGYNAFFDAVTPSVR